MKKKLTLDNYITEYKKMNMAMQKIKHKYPNGLLLDTATNLIFVEIYTVAVMLFGLFIGLLI